jgi:hypothetical protein
MNGHGYFAQLIELIATERGMADTIVHQHADDGTGHCRQCTTGAQAGRHVWPCLTYLAARQAQPSRS